MLSNKLFSFKPVVIFFFQKEGVGEAHLFKNAFHFTSQVKKKKMAVSWSLEAVCSLVVPLTRRRSKICRNVTLAGLKQERVRPVACSFVVSGGQSASSRSGIRERNRGQCHRYYPGIFP